MKAITLLAIKFLLSAVLLFGAARLVKANAIYHPAVSTVSAHTVAVTKATKAVSARAAKLAEMRMIVATASSIYDEMDLEDSGLSRKAFQYAWTGYYKLRKKGVIRRTGILSICDFSQSSSNQRMYVIDVRNRRLLYRTYVAHGINSGEEFASSFSNRPESCTSSLGFYVSQRILHKYGVMGTTFGCPAVPTEMSSQIIPVVKNGSCFFIYYPSKKYLSQSTVLNS